jgi:WD40 repeat protein
LNSAHVFSNLSDFSRGAAQSLSQRPISQLVLPPHQLRGPVSLRAHPLLPIFFSSTIDGFVKLWNIELDGRITSPFALHLHSDSVDSVQFLSSDFLVSMSSTNLRVGVIDRKLESVFEIQPGFGSKFIAFDVFTSMPSCVLSCSDSRIICANDIRVSTSESIHQLPVGFEGSATGLVLHDSAGFAAVSLSNGAVVIVDLRQFQVRFEFMAHEGAVLSIQTYCNTQLITSGSDCKMRVWNIDTSTDRAVLVQEISLPQSCSRFALIGSKSTASPFHMEPNQISSFNSTDFSFHASVLESSSLFDAASHLSRGSFEPFSRGLSGKLPASPTRDSDLPYRLLTSGPTEIICAIGSKLGIRFSTTIIDACPKFELPATCGITTAVIQLPQKPGQSTTFSKTRLAAVEVMPNPGVLLVGAQDGSIMLCK